DFGSVWKAQGNFGDALSEYHQAAKLARARSSVAAELPRLIRETEGAVALAKRLPDVLNGTDKPKNAAEGLAFAGMCYYKTHYAAATRLYGGALGADPKLAEDRQKQARYNAACAAALAAAGKGKDETAPDDNAKARLRGQSRSWLKAELVAWNKVLETGPTQA